MRSSKVTDLDKKINFNCNQNKIEIKKSKESKMEKKNKIEEKKKSKE